MNRRIEKNGGFTLVEVLIVVVILGILAGIVMPQFSNANLVARETTMRDALRAMREQVQIFKLQHKDVAPGYPGGDASAAADQSTFVQHMTFYTSDLCAVSATQDATYKFGPYLRLVPPNPINGKQTILIVQNGASLPAAASGTYGWIYQPETMTVLTDAVGTDIQGQTYFSY